MSILAFSSRRLAAAATIALAGATPVAAQFVAMNNYPQQPQARLQAGGPMASYGPAAYGPGQYGAAPYGSGSVAAALPAYPQGPFQQTPAAPAQAAQAPFGGFAMGRQPVAPPVYPQRGPAYVAQANLPSPGEPVAAPAAETIAPAASYPAGGPAMGGEAMGAYEQMPMQQGQMVYEQGPPMTGSAMAGYPAGGCPTGACGQQPSWEGYTGESCDGGCDIGYGSCAPACDLNAGLVRRRQWFGGLYGITLNRYQNGGTPVAIYVPNNTTYGASYYPHQNDNYLFTDEPHIGTQGGGEVRFGSTLGAAGCDGIQPYAWEVGYWGIAQSDAQAVRTIRTPVGPTNYERIHGLINYAGLQYDLDGSGSNWSNRPMPGYTHSDMPLTDQDIRLVGVRVRETFSAQNVELNFWRFGTPVAGGFGSGFGGFGGGGFGGGGFGGGGFGAGGCGPVGGACGGDACCPTACAPRRPRTFFLNGLCGVRYFRVDNDWNSAYQFTVIDTNTGLPLAGQPTAYTSFPTDDHNVLFHDIQVNNQLVGFQLGSSMNWVIGCRWGLFADTNFGIYGNQIDVRQRIYGGGDGYVSYTQTGGAVNHNCSTTDVAFLGEARVGAGYQVSPRCRLVGAYRVFGLSGVALPTSQIANGYYNSWEVGRIHSNDSLILHGLQAGAEFKY